MEEENNPWPTFVDAFSTVLCIFIFLMLIFVLNSMLIMYESAQKHYVNNTEVKENHILEKTNSQQTALNVITSSATQNTDAVTSEAQSQEPQTAEATENTQATEAEKSEIITLAQNQRTAQAAGKIVGRFDSGDKSDSTYEIQDKRFVIHFKQLEQGYSPEVIEKMSEWIKSGGKVASVTVYAHVSPSVSVSDAMRLAYQRGIILLKIVKEKDVNSNQEVAISVVNDEKVMSNSIVVTKSE